MRFGAFHVKKTREAKGKRRSLAGTTDKYGETGKKDMRITSSENSPKPRKGKIMSSKATSWQRASSKTRSKGGKSRARRKLLSNISKIPERTRTVSRTRRTGLMRERQVLLSFWERRNRAKAHFPNFLGI